MRRFTTPLATLLLAAPSLAQTTPDEALRALVAGNERFATGQSEAQPMGAGVRRTLARDQRPWAVVLTCSDSRVAPEHLFDAGLGELYVVRVAGNVCDPETLASIEYAAEHLGAPLCVVLGHQHCEVVKASLRWSGEGLERADDHGSTPALRALMKRIEPAVRAARRAPLGGEDLAGVAEEENAQLTAQSCMAGSPVLRHLEGSGHFRMVAARYQMDDGRVQWLPNRPWTAPASAEPDQHVDGPATGVPPQVALRMLRAGHRRFLSDARPTADVSTEHREDLAYGERPLAIVVTCSDSRVSPEHLFDAGLGELFVIRVAGNAINDDVLASVEYAALHTGASLCLVLGHTRCETLAAAAKPDGGHRTESMQALIHRLSPAVERARAMGLQGDALVHGAVDQNVRGVVAEARARSAALRRLEEQGTFAFLTAVYDLATGDLTWLHEDQVAAQTPQDEHVVDGGPAPHDGMPPFAAPMVETAPHGPAVDPWEGGDAHGSHAAPAPAPLENVEAAGQLTPTPGTSDSLVMLIAVLGLLSVGSAVVLVWNPREEG